MFALIKFRGTSFSRSEGRKKITHHFYFDNLNTRYEALLSQYGKTDKEVLRILPAQASLAGIFGDLDFSIVEEVSLRVYTNSDKTDYIESAYRYPTPINPSNTLDLLPSLADCKRVMADNRFGIDLAIRLRNTTADEMPVRLSLQFKASY